MNTLKDSYVVKITPNFDKKSIVTFQQSLKNTALNYGKSLMGSAKTKVASTLAGASLIGLGIYAMKKQFDDATESFDKFLERGDRLATLSGDLQNMSASDLLGLSNALQISGINSEMQDKLFANIEQAISNGELLVKDTQSTTDVLANLQKEWQKARSSGDKKTMTNIESLVGLRGKKASEFLQGDIKGAINQELVTFVAKEKGINPAKVTPKMIEEQKKTREKVIQKSGELEQKQAESLVFTQTKDFLQTGSINNSNDIIKAREQLELERIKATKIGLESYDTLIKSQTTLNSSMNMLGSTINTAVLTLTKAMEGLSQGKSILDVFTTSNTSKSSNSSKIFSTTKQEQNREFVKNKLSNFFVGGK